MTPSEPAPPVPDLPVPVSAWADGEIGERTRRTRRRLLLAAATVFDTHGYSGAALSDILAVAGLTKGALYFHFRSKQALAEALLVEVCDSWLLLVEEIGRLGVDPMWQLLLETDAYVARWMYDPLVRGISRAISEPDLREHRLAWLAGWEHATADRLRGAEAAGLLAAGVDPVRAARAVVAVASGNYSVADGPDDLWTRMSESWEGLVPIMTAPAWAAAWRASGWQDRPRPDAERYRASREP
ncbi:TetR/AcrR family transcriptional regulator [Actinomycetospora soli]|uniref:TetR/AcrR family transcriptional regulator n=1 Tax=Actinomycetospora soli TaxID=2893887 RepID=UPI001E317DF8|nr:TetR/AcrR family transcriptional regulator [Actinomycetospora soli]MCD2188171.1 TetR/AcrR family transcriptional regulator; helix-turn-helix transcriptional regulator [Actinomycetospora soli]